MAQTIVSAIQVLKTTFAPWQARMSYHGPAYLLDGQTALTYRGLVLETVETNPTEGFDEPILLKIPTYLFSKGWEPGQDFLVIERIVGDRKFLSEL